MIRPLVVAAVALSLTGCSVPDTKPSNFTG